MSDKKYTIEMTTDKGYVSNEYGVTEAVSVINREISAGKIVFIDGNICNKDVILEADIAKSRKNICITNKLIGG